MTRQKKHKSDSVREIQSNVKLNAPWFPKFYGMAFLKREPGKPVIFNSFAEGKKLAKWYKEILEDHPQILPHIILEICAAVTFIHQRKVFHGDLSLSNIIFEFKNKRKKFKITIIDLGMSGNIGEDRISGLTIDFWAYETLLKTCKEDDNEKLDIFALGSIIFHMYYRISFPSYFIKMHCRGQNREKVSGFNMTI